MQLALFQNLAKRQTRYSGRRPRTLSGEIKTSAKLPDVEEQFNKTDAGKEIAFSFEEFQRLLKPKSSSSPEDD